MKIHISLGALLLISGLLFPGGCSKDKEPEPQNFNLSDIDGNDYSSVYIFNNYWMTENLKTTKLNDSKAITMVSDDWNWDFLDEPKRCFYNNDGDSYRDIYGPLYNYYAVTTGKLCPEGWHIPTTTEWGTLIGYLGGYNLAGGKLKESGTAHWSDPNTGADNISGFTALPGGYRTDDGTYKHLGFTGTFWSSNDRMVVQISYSSSSATFQQFNKYNGASVRCVKNK